MDNKLRHSVTLGQRHSVTVIRKNPDMHVGERVRDRRKQLKMSIIELARRTGLAPSTLYDLERGDQKSTTKLHTLAAALRTTPQWLEAGKGSPTARAPLNAIQERGSDYSDDLTEAALEVARAWEQLDPPLRLQVQALIETLVTAQRRDRRKG